MKFEVGKFYRHNGGGVMHILGQVETTGFFNPCLVGEAPDSQHLLPVGTDEDAAVNWQEIPPHLYYQAWLKGNKDSKELQELATPPEGTDWPEAYSNVVDTIRTPTEGGPL
jgi:hypothetical protein